MSGRNETMMCTTGPHVQDAEGELLAIGQTIRQLKLDLKEQEEGVVLVEGKNELDRDEMSKMKSITEMERRIQEEVATLKELKERHCSIILAEINRLQAEAKDDDGELGRIQSLRNLLPADVAKKMKKKNKKAAKKKQTKKERTFDVHRGLEDVRCQRKIPHLLAHGKDADGEFRYFPLVNNEVIADMKEGDPVYWTEKMDGTTMQATNGGVFKRFERRGGRESGRDWHNLNEEERYSLERLDLENRSNRHMARAVRPYLSRFEKLPDGVCAYFEAIGPGIQKRFDRACLAETIQVFDTSHRGQFLPFQRTVEMCRDAGLPVVAHSLKEGGLCVSDILGRLRARPRYSDFDVPLEGYVIRPAGDAGGSAAKVRTNDLADLCLEGDAGGRGSNYT